MNPWILLWVDIGQAIQIISHSSELVSWWTPNGRKMDVAPEILRIATFLSLFLWGGYPGLVELLIYIMGGYWWIYANFCLS